MKKNTKNKAFTLIELLTVIAIIAMLTAIFGVSARKMKIVQRNLQQKAVFHGMEIGLELFSKDFDGYPDSSLVPDNAPPYVCGAQRLTEVLFGRDERGFNPRSKWHPSLDLVSTHPDSGVNLYGQSTVNKRKGPYTVLKQGDIYTVDQLWGAAGTGDIYTGSGVGTDRTPVVTDVFAYNRVTIGTETEKVGAPILYFKADATRRFRVDKNNRPVTSPTQVEYKEWIFNYNDNLPILKLDWLRELDNSIPGLDKHYKQEATNVQSFYKSLTEREADTDNDGTMDFFKPFNPSTYLLISAGYDGIYGTKDDITNFNY